MIDENYIAERLAMLRISKNISARDMSLSLGQSQSYINNIENNRNMPSMQMFLIICDYLKISPKDFFDEESEYPLTVNETFKAVKSLNREQQDLIIKLVNEIKHSK